MIAAVDTLLKDIRNKRIAPVYLIHGDEPYYLDRVADELEKVAVPVAERGFNQFVLLKKMLMLVLLSTTPGATRSWPSGSWYSSRRPSNWLVSTTNQRRHCWKITR